MPIIALIFILLLYISPCHNEIKKLESIITKLKIQFKKEKEIDKSSLLTGEKNKIDILTNQLNNEKNKNISLLKENFNLKKKIEELKLSMKQTNNQESQKFFNKDEIIELYKKIDYLNEKLKRYPTVLEQNEKLISIIFASSDQTMHYSMICKNTDTISDLEKRLYKEYPAFTKSENYFLCKGSLINKFKTFESYKIKNGDILIVNKRDE